MEFVTDTILQVVICVDVRSDRVDNFQWLFVEAAERAAVRIEEETGNPARSLLLGLFAVWEFLGSRLASKKSRGRLSK
jgi:hypothetical protein